MFARKLRNLVAHAAFLGLVVSPNVGLAQGVGEAALRVSLMLSSAVSCSSQDPVFDIASVPAEDESQTLDDQVLVGIEGLVLEALRREALDCTRITEVDRAFDTLNYIQNLGRWEELGAEQRARVASDLSDADATLTMLVNRIGDGYVANLTVVELETGRTLASARAEIPSSVTEIRCGASAAAEERGLATLAASLIERLPNVTVVYVSPATYQNSFDPLGYGRYISDQFIAALSHQSENAITGERLAVRQITGSGDVELGTNEQVLTLRYWPCEDLSAVRLNVEAMSQQGDIVTLGQDLSLAALPAGIEIEPQIVEVASDIDVDDGLLDLGLVSVEPRLIRAGQLLTVSAEPPVNCNPFFFDVSPSGRLTPIPLEIFDTLEIRPGLLRYDNNADSQYGIIVQPEDDPGLHRLGFICQPSGICQDGERDVLRQLRREHLDSTSGVIETEGEAVVFNTMVYEILR